MKPSVAAILILAFSTLAAAQSSSSYRLSEFTFNQGGRPESGVIATSASFSMTLDAIGEVLAPGGLTSPSFHLSDTFPGAYPPPGEVLGLLLDTSTHLLWDSNGAAGTYNVYRGTISSLPGSCLASGLATAETTDILVPAVGLAYFYVVTVSNLLGEEGTKGFNSAGVERPNPAPCP